MPDQLYSRVGSFGRGCVIPLTSWFGSLPEPVSIVSGIVAGSMPSKMLAGRSSTAVPGGNVVVP